MESKYKKELINIAEIAIQACVFSFLWMCFLQLPSLTFLIVISNSKGLWKCFSQLSRFLMKDKVLQQPTRVDRCFS